MPNAKWYAENYDIGDGFFGFVQGTIERIDDDDDGLPVRLSDGSWVGSPATTPILGPEGYDNLVEACNLDELLAAIERKVGATPPSEPEYRTGCHWSDLKVGDLVLAPVRKGGSEVVEVCDTEPPGYGGALPIAVCGSEGEVWWMGDDDPGTPYKWPEGISYDD